MTDVLQIFPGLLPAKEEGSDRLAVREIILDHFEKGGPKGLYSVSGVKFTTARLVAEKTLKQIFGQEFNLDSSDGRKPLSERELGIVKKDWAFKQSDGWDNTFKEIIHNESVVHLDDLIIRRTTLGDDPQRALENSQKICALFGWDENRRKYETNRLENFYNMRKLIK
jgi:glycerol-3-phosphate dehydrogenase